MMGDRYGEVTKVTRGKVFKNRWGDPEEIAHVKLDKSGKTVRVILADCTEADVRILTDADHATAATYENFKRKAENEEQA
jgi:hypothetical protein